MVLVTGRHYVVGIAGFPFSFSCFGNCVGTDSRIVEISGVVVDTSIDYSCVLQAHHRDFLLRSSFVLILLWVGWTASDGLSNKCGHKDRIWHATTRHEHRGCFAGVQAVRSEG
jgi:hypothetical protein